jgi:predicted small metal-binding protein
MARMMVDCRDMPSESNCTLAIAGDDVEDLLDAAVLHAVNKHGHEDSPELREGIRGGLKPVEPAMA